MKKIALVMGGLSLEREVSLKTGEAIFNALKYYNLDIVKLDPKNDDFFEEIKKVNIVYNALHGKFGEDGLIQGFLETLKIPYTGSSVLSSAIAMDKVYSRQILHHDKIPFVPFFELNDKNNIKNIPFKFPIISKPINEGSSVGLELINNDKELKNIEKSLEKYHKLLIEPYIKGREIQVALLDNEILGEVEIIPKGKLYDYEAKYKSKDTKYVVSPKLDDDVRKNLYYYSKLIKNKLRCSSIMRIDFIIKDKEIFFLELNTLPGMTEKSLVPKIAENKGISFRELCKMILDRAKIHGE